MAALTQSMYNPYQQFPWLVEGPKHLVVRTSATVKPESLVHAVTEEIHRVDKNQPVADVATTEEICARTNQAATHW